MNVNNYIITMILSIFIVLSIIVQLRRKFPLGVLLKMDPYGILPYYCFFAPLPLTSDFRIIYRVVNKGNNTDFKEFIVYTPRNWYQCVFNPSKFYRKALIDLCISLIS